MLSGESSHRKSLFHLIHTHFWKIKPYTYLTHQHEALCNICYAVTIHCCVVPCTTRRQQLVLPHHAQRRNCFHSAWFVSRMKVQSFLWYAYWGHIYRFSFNKLFFKSVDCRGTPKGGLPGCSPSPQPPDRNLKTMDFVGTISNLLHDWPFDQNQPLELAHG